VLHHLVNNRNILNLNAQIELPDCFETCFVSNIAYKFQQYQVKVYQNVRMWQVYNNSKENLWLTMQQKEEDSIVKGWILYSNWDEIEKQTEKSNENEQHQVEDLSKISFREQTTHVYFTDDIDYAHI
jgi:hypothetical protein